MVEQLFEVWRVTEYRDGAIFRTENTGELRWVALGENTPKDFLYIPVSEPNVKTIRMKG